MQPDTAQHRFASGADTCTHSGELKMERIAARILISDLSGIVHRSHADFARAFKQTFGQIPQAYVARRRVELASHLMRISEDAPSNIALTCGFTG